MNKNLKHLLCTTGICVILSLAPGHIFAQSNDFNSWNELGGFGTVPSPAKEQQKIELPVPPKPVAPGLTKADTETKHLESLKVEAPKDIKPIEIPSNTGASQSSVKEMPSLADDTKISNVVEEKSEKPIKHIKKGQTRKPVVIKDLDDDLEVRTKPTKKYLPHEKIKLNSTLSSVLARDEDVEKEIKATQDVRWKYDNKAAPKKFFVENAKNESNQHLPRLVYQKEYSELLFAAIAKDDVGAIKTLLANRADIDSRLVTNGYSTVMQATKLGNIRTLRYLILKGANLNLQDKDGKTALHLAASEGKIDFFNIIAAAGANASIKDYSGKTALDYAVPQIKPTLELTIAQTASDKNKAMFELVSYGSTNGVSKIIEAGANVNAVNAQGDTPLTLAAKNNDSKMTHLLLSKGANPLAADRNGDTPVKIATKLGNVELAQVIDTIAIRRELESGQSSRLDASNALEKPVSKKGKLTKKEPVIIEKSTTTIEEVLKDMKQHSPVEPTHHNTEGAPMNILEDLRAEKEHVIFQKEEVKEEASNEPGFFDSIFSSFKGAKSEEECEQEIVKEEALKEEPKPKKKMTALERHRKAKAAKKEARAKELAAKKAAEQVKDNDNAVVKKEELKPVAEPHVMENKAETKHDSAPTPEAKQPAAEHNESEKAASAITDTKPAATEAAPIIEQKPVTEVQKASVIEKLEKPSEKADVAKPVVEELKAPEKSVANEVETKPATAPVAENVAPKTEKSSVKADTVKSLEKPKKAQVKKKDLPKNIVKKTIEPKIEEKEISELSEKNPWSSITDLFKRQDSAADDMASNDIELPSDAPVSLLP